MKRQMAEGWGRRKRLFVVCLLGSDPHIWTSAVIYLGAFIRVCMHVYVQYLIHRACEHKHSWKHVRRVIIKKNKAMFKFPESGHYNDIMKFSPVSYGMWFSCMCVFQVSSRNFFHVCVRAVCFGSRTVGVNLSSTTTTTTTKQSQLSPRTRTLKAPFGSHEHTAHAACRWIVLVSVMKLCTKLLQINQ